MKKTLLLLFITHLALFSELYSQTLVNSLDSLRIVIADSNQHIILTPGEYNLEDTINGTKGITFSGSNNVIDLSGVYLKVPVGCIQSSYIIITGNNINIKGGEIEDVYRNGLTEITDFSAYNQDRSNLAYGLKGAAVVRITGNNNLIDGLKLTTRGSFPYGYGSMYGIGSDNVFGLNKRCGIVIKGKNNTLDNVEVQQKAFGHAIYTQFPADNTTVKNCYIEGSVRPTADFYNDTMEFDLPFLSDYKMPLTLDEDGLPVPIPMDQVSSLMEDGIRVYTNGGSITVENCIVKKARGGIRLYLSSGATATNSTAIDCGSTNFNLPFGGSINGSSANFAYAPLSDFRLAKNDQNIEVTIIPSPHATGPHNIADIQGDNHKIVFHRTPGPIDTTSRAIVVTGKSSSIVNETEYPMILESTARLNVVSVCSGATIIDNGSLNTIKYRDCEGITSDVNNLKTDPIAVSPNPARDKILVSFNKTITSGALKVSLHALNGQKILEINPHNKNEVTLDISDLKRGIYFLNIIEESKRTTKKIVKI